MEGKIIIRLPCNSPPPLLNRQILDVSMIKKMGVAGFLQMFLNFLAFNPKNARIYKNPCSRL